MLVLASKNEVCGAHVADGEVDFLVCPGALDNVGGTSCGTHMAGRKDAKGRQVLEMDLPEGGFCDPCQVFGVRSKAA